MGRFGRGLRLARASVGVVAANPVIVLVLLAGLVGMVVVSLGLFVAVFHRWPVGSDLTFPHDLIVLPVLGVGSIVSSYCAVVVAVMADRRLHGVEPRVADGIAVANARLGRIIVWTLLSAAVGSVVQLIEDKLKLGGWLASRVLGAAWGLATMFVVPVLALEDVGVRDAVRRSVSILRTKWGESLVADGAIGVVMLVAFIPIGIVIAIVGAASGAIAAAVVAGLLIGTLVLIANALNAVIEVALYRYAIDNVVAGSFTHDDLDASFRTKG